MQVFTWLTLHYTTSYRECSFETATYNIIRKYIYGQKLSKFIPKKHTKIVSIWTIRDVFSSPCFVFFLSICL